ncbi:DNA-binding protein [Bradyrhizobium sp. UFLA05-109]
MSANQPNQLPEDILEGARAIAIFLYGNAKYQRKVFYLVSRKRLPTFHLGTATIYARKSTLLKHIEEQEARRFPKSPEH